MDLERRARTHAVWLPVRRAAAAGAVLALVFGLASCDQASRSAPLASTPAPTAAPSGALADLVFVDANVITLAEDRPRADAVAVAGDRILAVGTRDEVDSFVGPATTVASLDGLTLVPGFIDVHQHRIGDGGSSLGLEPAAIVDAAIAQGYTTLHELYVDESRLGQLRDLDQAGTLRLRVNAYFAVNENGPDGRLFDPYYEAYDPGQQVSPRVRVAGLKVFTDFDNATLLLWDQATLNGFVLDRQREGWQLAIKTVSSTSLAMILEALEAAAAVEPGLTTARPRLEHMLFATPEQIDGLAELNAVPAINTNVPGQLVGEPDIDALIAREPAGSYAPWRSLFEAGIPAAGISGFPSFWVDEPAGAPFGSPMRLVYQAVTRAGNLGGRSPAALLGQALTAEQALRAHTINAARAAFEDGEKGSIERGKLADLVILSADPLTVPAEEIVVIETLMTMIGGRVEHCSDPARGICPEPGDGPVGSPTPPGPSATFTPGTGTTNVAPGATGTASSELPGAPATNAADGTDAHWNAAAVAPQWLELALPDPARVVELRLAQDPGGPSVHELWIGRGGQLERVTSSTA